jgi:DMSO/TMAO reductase YedYZ molybdopterin-dependent catalytic subunit
MQITKRTILILALIAALLLGGCSPAEETEVEEGGGGEAALTVSGAVDEELSLSMGDLEGMETMGVDYTDKDGETETYTGVPVNDILAEAGLSGDASAVVFVASDGYEAELPLADLEGCSDCVVAFDGGELRMVLPGFSGKVQVKGVVGIQVK